MRDIGKSKEPLLRDAYNRFQKFKKDFRYQDFSKYTDTMVKEIHRDLNYIDNLKTSTLEGAIRASQTFGRTRDILSSFSQEKQQEFWKIFNEAYGKLAPELIERVKYEVFNVVTTEMLLGQDMSTIVEELRELLEKDSDNDDGERDDGEFAENLRVFQSEQFEKLLDRYI